jgi:hypothetical protein
VHRDELHNSMTTHVLFDVAIARVRAEELREILGAATAGL